MAKFEDPGIKEFIRELEFSEKLEDNFFSGMENLLTLLKI